MDNNTNTQQNIQPSSSNPASTDQSSNTLDNPIVSNMSQDQSGAEFRSFTNIKTWGIVMGILNILSLPQVISFAFFIFIIIGSSLNTSSSTDATRGILPIILLCLVPIIMLALYIYNIYLGFTLKKHKGDFHILRRHIIILGVLSIFTPFAIITIISDVIVFAVLLPKYEQDLSVTSQSNQSNSSDTPTQNNQSPQPTLPES